MINNGRGILLDRQNTGEADRLAVIYTEPWGKISVRFVGVNKPGRKLKALSEPFVWAEYRLNFNPKNGLIRAAGGQIISSFPKIREDFDLTVSALFFCEALMRITPYNSPNPEKYQLLASALTALHDGSNPWLETAYGLKLLDLSGYGISDLALTKPLKTLCAALCETPIEDLDRLPFEPQSASILRETAYHHIEVHAEEPLRTRLFRAKLQKAGEKVGSDEVKGDMSHFSPSSHLPSSPF